MGDTVAIWPKFRLLNFEKAEKKVLKAKTMRKRMLPRKIELARIARKTLCFSLRLIMLTEVGNKHYYFLLALQQNYFSTLKFGICPKTFMPS